MTKKNPSSKAAAHAYNCRLILETNFASVLELSPNQFYLFPRMNCYLVCLQYRFISKAYNMCKQPVHTLVKSQEVRHKEVKNLFQFARSIVLLMPGLAAEAFV